jgi:hypothetical protein
MHKKRHFFQAMILLLLVCQGVILDSAPARAQSTPILSVEPAFTSVLVGSPVVLELLVTDGTGVNAFDITLTYNPAVLLLDKWAHGDYLRNLSCLHQVNQPGLLELACTQIARPPVSGDGVLLELTFDSLAAGASPITLVEAVFAAGTGAKTYPERQDGTVEVRALPTLTYTPTRTPTKTLTPTPTLTFTPTLTPTLTKTSSATPVASATQTPIGYIQPTPFPSYIAPTQDIPPTETPIISSPIMTEVPPTADGFDQGITATPTQVPDGAEQLTNTPTTSAVLPGTPEASEEGQADGWLEGLLWVLLIAGLLTLGTMWFIIIRGRIHRNKEEDLLL